MPLIVICGKPLTGKSTIAEILKTFFEEKYKSTDNAVCLVSDEDKLCEQGANEIYNNAQMEKDLRSWLKSETQRLLCSADNIVILDSLNYIKGYRYELYCLCKQYKHTFSLIECFPPSLSAEKIIEYEKFINNYFDEENADSNIRRYKRSTYDQLCQRYEPPTISNRWEEPLFNIEFGCDKNDLPLNAIDDVLFNRKKLKPNRSTQPLPVTTDNFIMQVDNQTQLVIKQIQQSLQLNQLRDIHIDGTDRRLNLNRKLSIAELNRFRRQFINYMKISLNDGFKDENFSIITAFVQFINNSVTS